MTKEQFRGKMKDIIYRFYTWILNPINILGLILYPIINWVNVYKKDYEHKFRVWVNTTRVFFVVGLKHMWKVFTFRGSYNCVEEYYEKLFEKTENEISEIEDWGIYYGD